MRVAFRIAVVMLTAAVLGYGFFAQVRILDVAVDPFLLLAVVAGLTGGTERGAVTGFVAGLTLDLMLTSPLGLTALAYCVTGFLAGRYQRSVVRSSRLRLMVTTTVASGLGYGLYVTLGWVLGQRNMLPDRLWVIVTVVSVANGLLAPLAARVLRWAWDEPRSTTFAVLR